MVHDPLQDRRKALEEEFFAREERRLLEGMRQTQNAQEQKAALSEVTGISDDTVLERFVEMELSPETVAAISLAPLVQVAWADGTLDSKERRIVLNSAREQAGLVEGGLAYSLLEGWLDARPSESLFIAWQEYVSALASAMDSETKQRFRADLLQRVRLVADAAGGALGFGRTSAAEREVLAMVEQALT